MVTIIQKVPTRIWLWVAIAVVAFFVGRVVLYEVRRDARNLAVAELAEKHADDVRAISDDLNKKLENSRKTTADLLQKLTAASTKATTERVRTRTVAATKVATVKTHTTTAELSKDVQEFLKVVPESVTDTSMTFSLPDTRGFVVTQLEYQDLQLEVEYWKHQHGIATQRIEIMADTQSKTDATLIAANDTIKALQTEAAAYKHAAKKSVWGKLVGGAKTVGIAVIPAAVVYLLMSGGK
jgi:hypothetical protein